MNTHPLFNPDKTSPYYLKLLIRKIKIQQSLKLWKKKSKKSKNRLNILKEWQHTQKAYIQDLELIIHRIQKPLLDKQLISQEEDRILFPNLDAMVKLSREMLGEIQGLIQGWNPNTTMIGASLINFHKYFIIYREYCNNFYKAQKILKQLRNQQSAQQIFNNLIMDVESYTIKPVQRPPKYQLLLRQYKKSLSQKHPDYPLLTQAITKYQAVNQQNNQSMDLQIRNDKMVELDKKYGGIISMTRVYLFEEYARTIQIEGKIKIYVFSDVLLIVRIQGEGQKEKQSGWRRVMLDGGSFVDAPMDGKYLCNKLFVCGVNQNLHCSFWNMATRDKVKERIEKIIGDLHQREGLKIKSKIKQKINIMKMQQIQIKPTPRVRITVVGVQKRPKPLVNLNVNINVSFETYYILKIQSPYPSLIFQYSYIKFDRLLALELRIRSANKQIFLPTLKQRPEDMNIYDAKKNKTKIIECRQIYIQRFVNYSIRAEQLCDCLEWIIKQLGICQHFWKFCTQVNGQCECQICQTDKQCMSMTEFEQRKQFIRSIVSPAKKMSNSFESTQYFGRQSFCQDLQKNSICLQSTMNISCRIISTGGYELKSVYQRISWLQNSLGRIDYSLFPKQISDKAIQPRNIILIINVLSLKQNENIKIKINKTMTVLEVLDQIAQMYSVQTLRDFALFLEYQQISRALDRDQILWEVLKQISYNFPQQNSQTSQIKPQSSSFWSNIKKWGSDIIIGKKQKLYIRKYIFIDQQIEIKSCEDNPQRYSLIVEQIFYRFKNQLLILNLIDTKKICALYYTVNNMDKLAHLTKANFQVQKLKTILPQSQWNLIRSQEFQRDVFIHIRQYEQLMENWINPNNANNANGNSNSNGDGNSSRRTNNNSSVGFLRIQVIYNLIIKLVNKVLGWSTIFFDVVNYDPSTLPGNCTNLLLGVNRKNIVLIRHKQLEPLLEIPLNKLVYKVTVYSIFIETQQRIFRFDGQIMYGIKKLIQIYKLLSQKFDNL